MMPKTLPGCGGDFWARRTNTYRHEDCTCPPARYSPTQTKPTDPECPQHGEQQ